MNIEDRLFERVEAVGVEGLTEPEKYYWLIWLLEAEANNGGLEQFFYSCAEYAAESIKALNSVGAKNMSSLLSQAKRIADTQANIEENSELREISNKFTDYPDDLAALLEKYVENNIAEFHGPKNELELWEQRKARGADTTPRVVTRNIDFEEEAKIDEQFSSRHCPECNQPVPDYRKTCKKCGYPIGRT